MIKNENFEFQQDLGSRNRWQIDEAKLVEEMIDADQQGRRICFGLHGSLGGRQKKIQQKQRSMRNGQVAP